MGAYSPSPPRGGSSFLYRSEKMADARQRIRSDRTKGSANCCFPDDLQVQQLQPRIALPRAIEQSDIDCFSTEARSLIRNYVIDKGKRSPPRHRDRTAIRRRRENRKASSWSYLVEQSCEDSSRCSRELYSSVNNSTGKPRERIISRSTGVGVASRRVPKPGRIPKSQNHKINALPFLFLSEIGANACVTQRRNLINQRERERERERKSSLGAERCATKRAIKTSLSRSLPGLQIGALIKRSASLSPCFRAFTYPFTFPPSSRT